MASKFGGIPLEEEVSTSKFGGVPVEQPVQQPIQQPVAPSLYERAKGIYGKQEPIFGSIGEDLSRRGENIAEVFRGEYPDKTFIEQTGKVLGELGKGVGDVVGETASRFVGNIDKDLAGGAGSDFLKQKMSEVASTEGGQEALRAMQMGVEYYNEWEKENPRFARNVSNIVGVAELIPAMSVGKKATQGAVDTISPFIEKGVEVAKPMAIDTAKSIAKGIGDIKGSKANTVEDIRSAEKALWGQMDLDAKSSGTVIKPNIVNKRFSDSLKSSLSDGNLRIIDPDVHPKSVQALDKINDRSSGAIQMTPSYIQDTKELIDGFISQSMDGYKETKDTLRLYAIKDAFDDAVGSLEADDFIAGDKGFYDNWKEARRVSSLRYKADEIEELFRRAELHPKNSSYEVALKNEFRNLAKNKKRIKPFNKEERFYIEKAAKTGNIEGFLEKISGFSPFSGKLGMVSSGGFMAYDPTVAIGLGTLGTAARAGSQAITRSHPRNVVKSITKQLNPDAEGEKSLAQQAFERLKNQKGVVKLGDDRVRVYHGTDADFDKFDLKKVGSRSGDYGMLGKGIYFSPDKSTASAYGKNLKEFDIEGNFFDMDRFKTVQEASEYLNIDPYFLTEGAGGSIRAKGNSMSAGMLSSAIKEKGFEGAFSKKRKEYVVYNPEILDKLKPKK